MADEQTAPNMAGNEDNIGNENNHGPQNSLIMGPSTANSSAHDLLMNNNPISEESTHPSSVNALHPLDEENDGHDTEPKTRDDKPTPKALPSIKGITDDNETLGAIDQNVRLMQYDSLAEKLFETEKDKLMIRARQAMFHVEITELRIAKMEEEIKQLRKDVDNLPEDFAKPKPRQPAYLREIKRVDSASFQFTAAAADIALEKRPVIEILLANRTSVGLPSDSNKVGPVSENRLLERRESHGPAGGVADPVVERIRIRSRPLVAALEKAVSSRLWDPPNDDDDHRATIFFRPFKLFVTYEKEIRSSFEALKAKATKHDGSTEAKNQDAIDPTKQAADDTILLKDMELLMEVFDTDLKSLFTTREEIRNGTLEKIEYGDLWHLFNYGDDIAASSDMSQVYRVVGFTGGRQPLVQNVPSYPPKPPHALEGFTIDCYSLRCNGKGYGPSHTRFTIRQYDGQRPINELTVFPFKFAQNFATLRSGLIDRGSRFLDLTSVPYIHKMYVGESLDEPPEKIESQVVVDFSLAINKNAQWDEPLGLSRDDLEKFDERETYIGEGDFSIREYQDKGGDKAHNDLEFDQNRAFTYLDQSKDALRLRTADALLEDEKPLLPLSVYGFVLRTRKWASLDLGKLSDVLYESNFDSLIIPRGHKDTVRALVRNHSKGSESQIKSETGIGSTMDLVRGKGKGLIILLHGEPGVGKTSTAECVADLTKRPLFSITCGDIGETAFDVQTSLDYNFQLAHKWGCVLLLDEADVFLAERTKDDLRRNAIVSVFLRTLEYYSGILFLTTNRVGTFDPAFKSRIHMSLFYPRLEIEATVNIYKLLLQRTLDQQRKQDRVEFNIKRKEITKFARAHFKYLDRQGLGTWNGRQIRNAFQTAIALVEYEARQNATEVPNLGEAQFKVVAEASEEFDKYLRLTQKGTDESIAYRKGIRMDKYATSQSQKATPADARVDQKRLGIVSKQPQVDVESDVAETESDETESESEDDEGVGSHKGKGNKSTPVEEPSKANVSSLEKSEEDDAAKEYAEFLKFQAMRKGKK